MNRISQHSKVHATLQIPQGKDIDVMGRTGDDLPGKQGGASDHQPKRLPITDGKQFAKKPECLLQVLWVQFHLEYRQNIRIG